MLFKFMPKHHISRKIDRTDLSLGQIVEKTFTKLI